jgi:hypothetical protein
LKKQIFVEEMELLDNLEKRVWFNGKRGDKMGKRFMMMKVVPFY